MAFGSFGSAWREKAFYTDKDEPLHVADPSHTVPSADPNATWIAPADVHEQADFLYDGDAVVGDYFGESVGMVLDTTPVDHQDGGDFGVTREGAETTSANAATAGRSFGASRADTFAVPPFQDYTTRYLSPRFEGLAATPINPTVAVRGLNSNAENNPEGFRRGWVEQTFVDRKFYEGTRTHDRRYLTPNLAYMETDQAAVPGTSGSPFSTLARSIRDISQKPMIRREPVSISESITTDGSGEGYTYDSQPSDWVTQ